MKVLILSSEKLQLAKYDAEIKVVPWTDVKLPELNVIDYDGLIIDTSGIGEALESDDERGFPLANFWERVLTTGTASDILGGAGSFITVVGDPSISCHSEQLTDRLGVDVEVVQDGGESIKRSYAGEEFEPYYDKIQHYDYYFKRPKIAVRGKWYTAVIEDIFDTITMRSGYSLALKFCRADQTSGELRFVPVLPDGVETSINEILKIYLGSEEKPAAEPEWATSMKVEGQEALDAEINKVRGGIKALRQTEQQLLEERRELRKSLEVLYKSGKPLEESVKYCLRQMGMEVEEPNVSNKVEFFFSSKGHKFVAEVKSKKKSGLEKYGLLQVLQWQNERLEDTGENYKPVVIVSCEYDKPPDKRQTDFLPGTQKEVAESRGIAILTVQTLYDALQKIQAKQLSLSNFVKQLNGTSGIMKLS